MKDLFLQVERIGQKVEELTTLSFKTIKEAIAIAIVLIIIEALWLFLLMPMGFKLGWWL